MVDTVIFGGGIAGLWLLNELSEQGRSVVLLEAHRLGQGQTITAQGIIHGGLKYSLQGLLTSSAQNIREMPGLWRDCLAGRRSPNLEHTRLRAPHCYLWRTDSLSSRLGMLGAKIGLRVAPEALEPDDRPEVLKHCPGTVARLDEPVLSTGSLLAVLAGAWRDRILKIDVPAGLHFGLRGPGDVECVSLRSALTGQTLTLEPRQVVFVAGEGNEFLRKQVQLETPAMQRRPLHMVMARGRLPELNGHCVDGAKTRVTITSDIDSAGQTIWQIGGQVSEEGVAQDELTLIEHTRREVLEVIPGIDLSGTEWATYRVNRAEGQVSGGKRPDNIQSYRTGNVITAWPTKLALAPQLSQEIQTLLPAPSRLSAPELPLNWPRPDIALPPWEECPTWHAWRPEFVLNKAG